MKTEKCKKKNNNNENKQKNKNSDKQTIEKYIIVRNLIIFN